MSWSMCSVQSMQFFTIFLLHCFLNGRERTRACSVHRYGFLFSTYCNSSSYQDKIAINTTELLRGIQSWKQKERSSGISLAKLREGAKCLRNKRNMNSSRKICPFAQISRWDKYKTLKLCLSIVPNFFFKLFFPQILCCANDCSQQNSSIYTQWAECKLLIICDVW